MDLIEELRSLDINNIGAWSRRAKLLIAGLLGLVLVFLGYYFIISEQRAELENIALEEPRLKRSFLEKKALAINLDAYKKQMVKANQIFAELRTQLPNASEIPDLLTDITQVGLSRGLQFEQIKPGDVVTKDFYAEQFVDIRVSGQYHQIASFISDVAALPRIINVANFDMVRSDPNSTNLTLTAATKTYHYLDDSVTVEEQ